jgi:hypothetical protein
MLGQTDTVLVIGGTLEARGGQMQVIADALKRASLSTMLQKAKAEGFFDEEEARRGVVRTRPPLDDDVKEKTKESNGAVPTNAATTTPMVDELDAATSAPHDERASSSAVADEGADAPIEQTTSTGVHVRTIVLPARAPRQLLLDLKQVLQTFPGPERVQLQIGDQRVDVPLTVNMSVILEQKIADILARYAETPAGTTD